MLPRNPPVRPGLAVKSLKMIYLRELERPVDRWSNQIKDLENPCCLGDWDSVLDAVAQ